MGGKRGETGGRWSSATTWGEGGRRQKEGRQTAAKKKKTDDLEKNETETVVCPWQEEKKTIIAPPMEERGGERPTLHLRKRGRQRERNEASLRVSWGQTQFRKKGVDGYDAWRKKVRPKFSCTGKKRKKTHGGWPS